MRCVRVLRVHHQLKIDVIDNYINGISGIDATVDLLQCALVIPALVLRVDSAHKQANQ